MKTVSHRQYNFKMKHNKLILFVLLALIKSTVTLGQSDSLKQCDCKIDTFPVFGHPEKMATFPGGEIELFEYLNQNMKYPQEAIEQKLEDRVIIEFCIHETGKISDVTILRGKHKILNTEATRIVNSFPDWEPAYNKGKTICSKYVLPIIFKLEATQRKHKKKKTTGKAPNR